MSIENLNKDESQEPRKENPEERGEMEKEVALKIRTFLEENKDTEIAEKNISDSVEEIFNTQNVLVSIRKSKWGEIFVDISMEDHGFEVSLNGGKIYIGNKEIESQ